MFRLVRSTSIQILARQRFTVTPPGWSEPRRGAAILGVRLRTVAGASSPWCVVLLSCSLHAWGSALFLRGSWFSSSQAKSPFPHSFAHASSRMLLFRMFHTRPAPRSPRISCRPLSADSHPSACLKLSLPLSPFHHWACRALKTGRCLSASQSHGVQRSS